MRFGKNNQKQVVGEVVSAVYGNTVIADENAIRVKGASQNASGRYTIDPNARSNELLDITQEDFNKYVADQINTISTTSGGLTDAEREALAAILNGGYVKKDGDPQNVTSEITFKNGIYITDDTDTASITLEEKLDIYTANHGINVDGGVYATKFVKDGGTNTQVLLADGSTKALSEISGGGLTEIPANSVGTENLKNGSVTADKLASSVTNDLASKTWVNERISTVNAGGSTQVNSDWNVTDTSSVAYILNKPTLGALASKNSISSSDMDTATRNVFEGYANSIDTLQNNKVDKVSGKGLSTNDFTNAYKAILDGTGNNALVKYSELAGVANSLDTTQDQLTSHVQNTTMHVTAAEKAAWNAKLGSVPAASANQYGGIKTGYSSSGTNYAVQLDSNGKAFVNVPAVDPTTGQQQITSDTVSGWGFATTDQLASAISGLDVAAVGGTGKYITTISETDGKISATVANFPTIPTVDSALSSTSTNAVQNKAVVTALAAKADQSDLEQKANASDLNALSTTVSGKQDKITSSNAATVKSTLGLNNVGNFKAVSTVASQGLTATEQANARANIGAGTSNFSGNYNDLTNKPALTSGTVTSVAMTVPTGLSVSGSPITTSGTLALSFANGYSIPTTTKLSNWDTAYSWGNHAAAGYKTTDTNQTLKVGTVTFGASDVITLTSSEQSVSIGANATNKTINFGINTASANNLGGIKLGYTQSGKNYPVLVTGGGQAYVTVPWTDNNTTYNAATTSAAGLMSAADKSKLDGIAAGATANTGTLTAVKVNNTTASVSGTTADIGTVVRGIKLNGSSLTGNSAGVVDLGTLITLDTNTTYSAGNGISLNGTTFSLVKASSNNLGGIATGYTQNGKNYPVAVDTNGHAYVNVPWTDTTYTVPTKVSQLTNDSGFTSNAGTITAVKMNNATVSASGIADLGNVVKTIKLNGTNLTGTSAGLVDLGNLATTSQIPTVDSALSATSTNAVQNKVINTALAGKADQSDLEQKANTSDLNALSSTVSGKQDKITTSNAASVRSTLGLGTLATQNSIAAATTSAAGLMSATDKAKLDGIASGATANSGTITSVRMNSTTVSSSGIADLGNVVKTIRLNGSDLSGTSAGLVDLGNLATTSLIPTIDSLFSTTSTNPVQNKVILAALNAKADQNDLEQKANKSEIPDTSNFITKNTGSTAADYLLLSNGQTIAIDDVAGSTDSNIPYGTDIYSNVSTYSSTVTNGARYFDTSINTLCIKRDNLTWVDSQGFTVRRNYPVGSSYIWQPICKHVGGIVDIPRFLDLDPQTDKGFPFFCTDINKQLYLQSIEVNSTYDADFASVTLYKYRWVDSAGRTWAISSHTMGSTYPNFSRQTDDNMLVMKDGGLLRLFNGTTTTSSNINNWQPNSTQVGNFANYANIMDSLQTYADTENGFFTSNEIGRTISLGGEGAWMLTGVDSDTVTGTVYNGYYGKGRVDTTYNEYEFTNYTKSSTITKRYYVDKITKYVRTGNV